MYLLGCLPILLIVAIVMVFAIFGRTLALVGTIVERLGATVVWLWDSFTNLFRSENSQKRVVNPWTGKSNFYPLRPETASASARDSESHAKIYGPADGEYIDFEEIG